MDFSTIFYVICLPRAVKSLVHEIANVKTDSETVDIVRKPV
jgi:hypothetical protein